jgi:hypothetical protein
MFYNATNKHVYSTYNTQTLAQPPRCMAGPRRAIAGMESSEGKAATAFLVLTVAKQAEARPAPPRRGGAA